MFCANCGREAINNGKFCVYCGAPKTAAEMTTPLAEAETQAAAVNPAAENEQPIVMFSPQLQDISAGRPQEPSAVIIRDIKPEEPERLYTAGQLIMCLAAAAVMAIAAGIFAGLYFLS